jgi:sorbitol/mannitol transport system permease protein
MSQVNSQPLMPRRRKKKVSLGTRLLTLLTWVIVLLVIFPVLFMVLTAFKTETAAASFPPQWLSPITFENFEKVFDRGFLPFLLNSFIASIGSTILVMILAIPAAYALTIRPILKWRDALFFLISTRFMPLGAVVIPLYLLISSLRLLDNIWVIMVLYVGLNLPIAIWMMRSFLEEVPREIIEAAQLDGAGIIKEITRVVMPIVAPGAAAAALIVFIFAWNEYFLVFNLTADSARTLPPFLGSFVDARGQFLAALSAAATLAVTPVVIAGWVAQKRLVRGLSMGALK